MSTLSAILGMDGNSQLHYGQLGDTFPGVVSVLYTSQSTTPVGNTTTGSSGSLGITGGLQFSTGVTGQAFADLSNSGTAVTIDTTASSTLDILFSWSSLVTNQAVKTVSATGLVMN